MTATTAGKDMLIKADLDGDGTFTTIAGAQTRSLKLNGTLVDITNQDSEGNWREAVAGVDVKSMTISMDGVLARGVTFATLNQMYMDAINSGYSYQVYMPGLGKYEGRFVLTDLEFTGEQNDVVKFSATMESSGPVALTYLSA